MIEAGRLLYITGCMISLGFALGTMDEHNKGLNGIISLFICWLLSWAGVIACIIDQKVKEDKKRGAL